MVTEMNFDHLFKIITILKRSNFTDDMTSFGFCAITL